MRSFLRLTALSFILFLAACDSKEDRAEEFFESAQALLADGDPDRALVELRNVFQLVPNHFEARHTIALIYLEEKNDPRAAYREYLRLVEQFPDDLLARTVLSELAFYSGNWGEMERHASRAIELAPDDTRVMKIATALAYRDAVEAEDEIARKNAVQNALSQLDAAMPSRMLRELILDDALRDRRLSEALASLDVFVEEFPDEPRYWNQRLQILVTLGEEDRIEEQLVQMIDRFPSDDVHKQTLIRYYLSREELDKAEAFLRQLVADAPSDEQGARIDLIRFLTELRGPDAARAEIAAAIEVADDPAPFVSIGASLDFATGNQDRAVRELEEAIANAEPSEQTNGMKTTLARMLLAMGNDVGARALAEAVLAEEPNNVEALKMRAAWLIDADDTDAAIAALRSALETNPDDAPAMTLMATAYARAGSNDLARDFLSLAVEASGNAPGETVRYARVLINEERFRSAEDLLLPALRLAPGNVELLQTAGQLYLQMEDFGRLDQVVRALRAIGTPQTESLATQLEAERLNRTGGSAEAMQYLESLATGEDSSLSNQILLLRARLSTGDGEGALTLAQELLQENPDNVNVQAVLATTHAAVGNLDDALEIFQSLADQFPQEAPLQLELSSLQARMGDVDASRATIAAALDASPDDLRLLWASASFLEQDNDIDGAIEIYERMYAADSSSIVVANNLASLIGTYRDDAESLDRAWSIARRFRDADVPAIQDTYGWLTHRRGDSRDALTYLRSAAAALTTDPIVQYHLAEALYAVEDFEAALEQYRVVLTVAGVADERAQIATARARIAELEEALAATE